MVADLRDQLVELADDARPSAASSDLWVRGKRRQRRRTATWAGVTAALLVVVGVGMTGLVRPATGPVQPAGGLRASVMRLPDHLWKPSAWLAGTADQGPLGTLALITQTDRDSLWHGASTGTLGVSAGTGSYRFLDLPDAEPGADTDADSDPQLSPSGRYVGYWTHGSGGLAKTITGFSVYDATTGTVIRTAALGGTALGSVGATWVDDTHVLVSVGRPIANQAGSYRLDPVRMLDVRTGRVVEEPRSFPTLAPSVAGRGPGRAILFDQPVTATRVLPAMTIAPLVNYPVFVSPDGRRVAATLDTDGSSTFTEKPTPLMVGHGPGPDGKGLVDLLQIDGDPVSAVVGWRDDQHVVVLTTGRTTPNAYQYDSVDIRSGDRTRLLTVTGQLNLPQFSQAALTAPTYAAPKPPHPLDRRLLVGGAGVAAGALSLLGVAGFVRRRRV